MGKHADKAIEIFVSGSNCAQAVFAAFADKMGMDEAAALRLSSSFGGGMGKFREVCGAVSGMFMVAGALYGYDYHDDQRKEEHYRLIQDLGNAFKAKHQTMICRELLELDEKVSSPVPTKRNEQFYAERPCARYVRTAAELLEQLIESK